MKSKIRTALVVVVILATPGIVCRLTAEGNPVGAGLVLLGLSLLGAFIAPH